MKLFVKPFVAAIATGLVLTGCSNQPETNVNPLQILRSVINARKAPAGQPPQPAVIANAVANTTGPLELGVRADDQTKWLMLIGIEQNGAYTTYGAANRTSITMRHGIVTATRGLGGDLMSVNISEVEPLILGRRNGQATREMHFLGGEDKTVTLTFSCTIKVGKSIPVKAGAVNTTAQVITETCSSKDLYFTNTYLVNAQGRSVGSRQWLGDAIETLDFQTLRL